MSRKIRFNAAYATMLLPFISKDPFRHYLCGIAVEPWEDGVILVATNGHILGAVYDPVGEASGSFICAIPPALAKALPKDVFRSGELHFIGDAAYLLDGTNDDHDPIDVTKPSPHHLCIAHAPAIDGAFPDWRRVIPGRGRARSDVTVNPALLDSFKKAAAVVGRGMGITLRCGGTTTPVVVQIEGSPQFVGAVMPMSGASSVAWDAPRWAVEAAPKDEAA